MNAISILVVNYNNLQYTKNLINGLEKQSCSDFDLNIVDQNSSELGTKEYLNSLPFKVIYNEQNVDLNRVWNWFNSTNDSQYHCFLNNDIEVTENFVENTIEILNREPDVAIVMHATNSPMFLKPKSYLEYVVFESKYFQGWDFTIRKENYTQIPDELRLLGGDDLLFANVYKKGLKTAMCTSSPILHYKEQTRMLRHDMEEIQENDRRFYGPYHKSKELPPLKPTTKTKYSSKKPKAGMCLSYNITRPFS